MPGATLQINRAVKPPRAMAKALRELGVDLGDWRPAWQELLPYMSRGLERNIRTQGGSIGAKWQDLRPQYAARKARKAIGGKRRRVKHSRGMLLLSGKTWQTVANPRRAKRSLTKTRLQVGPNKRYQFVQHFGSKKLGIPARPFVAWPPPTQRIALRIMHRHADRLVAEASKKAKKAMREA